MATFEVSSRFWAEGDDVRGLLTYLRARLFWAALVFLSLAPAAAQAQCIGNPVQTSQTCTNSGTLTDTSAGNIPGNGTTFNFGLHDTGTINLTNAASGFIAATTAGGNDAIGVYADNGGSVANYGSISSVGTIGVGFFANGSLVNAGTIRATGAGADGVNGANTTTFSLINTGVIFGAGYGLASGSVTTIVNSGSITGGTQRGVSAAVLTLTNTGSITGGNNAGVGLTRGTINNSGTISGSVGIRSAGSGGTTTVINSGTVIGTGGTAFQFGATGNAQHLTLLPGSRIVGAIDMGGSAGSTVNIVTGAGQSSSFTIGNHTGALNVSGTAPYVVSGNRVVIVDTSSSSAAGVAVTDFSRTVAGLVPNFPAAPPAGGSAIGFAAEPASRFDEAFAGIPGLSSYASSDRVSLSNAVMMGDDGTAVWARGFAGKSVQAADGAMLGSANTFFGGAIGVERPTASGIRLGAYLGGGVSRTSLEQNSGNTRSDLAVGGLYSRFVWSETSLRLGIQGGVSWNHSERNIANNLAPGGNETATAGYTGWYLSPELKLDRRIPLGSYAGAQYAITPSLQVRYLYSLLGGYTETGTTANLTMNSRAAQSMEERAEVKLARTVAFGSGVLETSLSAGPIFVQRMGDNTVIASLLGQPVNFVVPGKSNMSGGFLGAGFEVRSRGASIFASLVHESFLSAGYSTTGQAGLRVAF